MDLEGQFFERKGDTDRRKVSCTILLCFVFSNLTHST